MTWLSPGKDTRIVSRLDEFASGENFHSFIPQFVFAMLSKKTIFIGYGFCADWKAFSRNAFAQAAEGGKSAFLLANGLPDFQQGSQWLSQRQRLNGFEKTPSNRRKNRNR